MPKKNEYTISLKQEGPPAKETSSSIAEQVNDFLKSGGEIDQIPSGVSGQISLGEKARLAKEEQQKKAAEKLQVQNMEPEAVSDTAAERAPDAVTEPESTDQ